MDAGQNAVPRERGGLISEKGLYMLAVLSAPDLWGSKTRGGARPRRKFLSASQGEYYLFRTRACAGDLFLGSRWAIIRVSLAFGEKVE